MSGQLYGNQFAATPYGLSRSTDFPPPPRFHHEFASAPQPSIGDQTTSSPIISSHAGSNENVARVLDNEGIPKGSIYAQNKAKFDNPLAHNEAWAPTQEDQQLRQLPKVDFALRVKSRLTRSAGKPFEPEPRSFQRHPPIMNATRPAFRPIVLQSDGKTGLIGAGFKPYYFGPLMAAHDVSAADFARFLEDIFTAGKVGGAGQVVANVAPLTMHMGITGYFVTKAIVKGMARRNEPLVVETIVTWQERFFGPRGLDVYVVFGDERVTGRYVGEYPEPLAPEVAAMVNAASIHLKHTKKDREKVKDARPFLVVAPLNADHECF